MDPMIDLDRELARSTQVDPSPDFTARVRARIANEPPAWQWRVPGLAIAMTAAIAIGVAASNLLGLLPASGPTATPGVLERRSLNVVVPLRASVPAMTPPDRPSPVQRIVISKSEMLALQQLFAGAIVAPPPAPIADELSISELVIEAIVMPPIPGGERQ